MPSSLEIVLWLDNSPKVKSNDHIIKDDTTAPKENKDVFKNLAEMGTKKNIITTNDGTKNGYINILYKALFITSVLLCCFVNNIKASIAFGMVKLTLPS